VPTEGEKAFVFGMGATYITQIKVVILPSLLAFDSNALNYILDYKSNTIYYFSQ
jgi:hypothetical protein